MISLELQQQAGLPGLLRDPGARRSVYPTRFVGKCLKRPWSAGIAALAFWCSATAPATARTDDLKYGQQNSATFEPHTSVGTPPSAAMNAAPCDRHEIVAISTQMIAIITRAGDTLENLQACYTFDPQRTNSENELLTNTFRAGQIILLFK